MRGLGHSAGSHGVGRGGGHGDRRAAHARAPALRAVEEQPFAVLQAQSKLVKGREARVVGIDEDRLRESQGTNPSATVTLSQAFTDVGREHHVRRISVGRQGWTRSAPIHHIEHRLHARDAASDKSKGAKCRHNRLGRKKSSGHRGEQGDCVRGALANQPPELPRGAAFERGDRAPLFAAEQVDLDFVPQASW